MIFGRSFALWRVCLSRCLTNPPLHEFLPHEELQIGVLAAYVPGRQPEAVRERVEKLHESNPMLGHRGWLGITTPDIYNMQVQAIMEAACELHREGVEVHPEIMVRLGHVKE